MYLNNFTRITDTSKGTLSDRLAWSQYALHVYGCRLDSCRSLSTQSCVEYDPGTVTNHSHVKVTTKPEMGGSGTGWLAAIDRDGSLVD